MCKRAMQSEPPKQVVCMIYEGGANMLEAARFNEGIEGAGRRTSNGD